MTISSSVGLLTESTELTSPEPQPLFSAMTQAVIPDSSVFRTVDAKEVLLILGPYRDSLTLEKTQEWLDKEKKKAFFKRGRFPRNARVLFQGSLRQSSLPSC